MSRADLLRSLSAPPELIEADLVDQLADASAALARLRAATPDDHDPAWSRHYSQAQNQYHKALGALLKFRKTTALPSASRSEPHTTAPAAPNNAPAHAPVPAPRPPLDLSHLNRHQRRRLDALRRAAPERRQRMLASASHGAGRTHPDRSHSHPDEPPAQASPR